MLNTGGDSRSNTVRLFCRVHQGNSAVLDADVVAIVEAPDGEIQVSLHDDGRGEK